ncbi:TniQ family protein [Oceaniovalibus guishaninsula]|uniref:TniQ family protein n=1 Tax=Oceaniovalibus guishaninsula TaxID=1046117 RepID=UPI0009FBED42|nr:TniQ family protein [Oceaniovalibus guishaninsula]
MSVLVPFLPYDPCETPMSFAARLASFHLGARVVPFLHDIGIRPEALVGCEFDAVEQLAGVTGVDSAALHRNSAHRIRKRRFELRGHEFTAEFFASPYTVFCPACLRDDDALGGDPALFRKGRLLWTPRPVRTCPMHGLELVRRKKVSWDDAFHQMALRVPERAEALDELVDRA